MPRLLICPLKVFLRAFFSPFAFVRATSAAMPARANFSKRSSDVRGKDAEWAREEQCQPKFCHISNGQ